MAFYFLFIKPYPSSEVLGFLSYVLTVVSMNISQKKEHVSFAETFLTFFFVSKTSIQETFKIPLMA